MKKTWKLLVSVLLLSLVALGPPAQATTLSVTPGSVYIDLGVLENTLPTDWSGDDQTLEHSARSCASVKLTAVTTPTLDGGLSLNDCKELSAVDQERSLLDGSGFDLSTAYAIVSGSWVSYDPLTHGRHIVMVTKLTDSGTDYYIHTASSYLFPTEDVTLGSFSLDGNDVTHFPSVFSKLRWDYLVACAAGTNPIEKTEPRLIGETGTGVVPLTEDGGFNCARIFDANSNPTDPDSINGGVVSSLENAVFHDGTEFISFGDSGRKSIALETIYVDNNAGQGEKWFTNTNFEEYVAPSTQSPPPSNFVTASKSPSISLANGTDVGDTVVVDAAAVWNTTDSNDLSGPTQYGWQYATSCSANSFSTFLVTSSDLNSIPRTDTFQIPAQIFDSQAQSTPIQTTGIVLAAVARFTNFASNSNGMALSQRFVVGGNFCPAQTPPSSNNTTPSPVFSAPAPFQGPVITAPSIPSSNAPGSTITIPGENLDGVSAVSIGSTDAEVEVVANQLEVVVPETLEAGTYDLVISSSTGKVTISDAITVAGAAITSSEAPRGSTNREDDEVKIRVFNPAAAGKVQIIVNGEEIAWVRTDDPNDSKLFNGYLVRTVKLEPGKNVIEILVDGERIRRNAYTL